MNLKNHQKTLQVLINLLLRFSSIRAKLARETTNMNIRSLHRERQEQLAKS